MISCFQMMKKHSNSSSSGNSSSSSEQYKKKKNKNNNTNTSSSIIINNNCGILISILETVRTRCCNTLEAQVGHGSSKRLICHLITGGENGPMISDVLRTWVDGVVLQHTDDPDIICVSRILLALFVVEACALKTTDYRLLKTFCLQWIHRCILKLGVGFVVSVSGVSGGGVSAAVVLSPP